MAVYCQVYDEELETAGTIHQLLGMALQDRQVDSMVPWAVTIDNGHPAAWLEVFYLVDRPGKGKAGGLLKLAISAREDHPILCFHDEVGYKESFRHVAQEFFRSFAPSQRAAEPNYLDVVIRYEDDVPIGFKKSVSIEENELAGYQRWATHGMLMAVVDEHGMLQEERLHLPGHRFRVRRGLRKGKP